MPPLPFPTRPAAPADGADVPASPPAPSELSLVAHRERRERELARLLGLRQALAALDALRMAAGRLLAVVREVEPAEGVPVRATRAVVGSWLDALAAPDADHARVRELPRLLTLAREHVLRLPFAEDVPAPALACDSQWEQWAARKGGANVVLRELLVEAEAIDGDLRDALHAADARAAATAARVRGVVRRQRTLGERLAASDVVAPSALHLAR